MALQRLEVRIDPPLAGALRHEVQGRLAFIDENVSRATIDDAGRVIALELYAVTPDPSALASKVQRVVQTMRTGPALPGGGAKAAQLTDMGQSGEDPTADMLARHQMVRELDGVFALGPQLTALVDYFDERLVRIARDAGATAYRFPALISASVLERLNYFRAFPHTLTFATHLRRDLDVIEAFADGACCNDDDVTMPPDSLAAPKAMLSPAVCYHLYTYFEGKSIPPEGIVATAVGHCFRQEASNMVSLERMWDFTMREIMIVGTEAHVEQGRERVRPAVRAFMAEAGISHSVEDAHDPFFIGEFARQGAFQQAFGLKQELRALLPFSGATLAVGSYNYHQDFFGRKLNITLADGSPAHTGCIAFGLERLVYAFLAQHGTDAAQWPALVRAAMQ